VDYTVSDGLRTPDDYAQCTSYDGKEEGMTIVTIIGFSIVVLCGVIVSEHHRITKEKIKNNLHSRKYSV
jgi:hypothetical protein